jgi:SpoVK/Ycf46/Vps4 family AAA+-type ATPase
VDLYRLDLARVVDKYIGQTEKHLAGLLAAAEEADVALLLDEGEALLGERTAVRSSTDRYANLETNFLLARLESFEGVILITTNAPDRVDAAFARRMDVVVEFHAPQPAERRAIWTIHLPDGHTVASAELAEVSGRCALTGGQIHNAAQHARLLALDGSRPLDSGLLRTAVRREYGKAGEPCPLAGEPAVG